MPIHKDFHPQYNANIDSWTINRDVYEGEKAIKKKGVKYLPKLSGQNTNEYNAYKLRALFYAITAKTISAMVGMATSKEPSITFPEEMNPYFKDSNGIQYEELKTRALSELLLQGRVGILADRAYTNAPILPIIYTTENILNWEIVDGRVTMVALREVISVTDANDRFKTDETLQYKELYIDSENHAAWRTYDAKGRLTGKGGKITTRGVPATEIPFYCYGPSGQNFDVERSPVTDIVAINLSHYRSSADLENARHFLGTPTPVIIGAREFGATGLKIGTTTAWGVPIGGDAKYLEFTGQGLESLEKALKEKETQMASLSARLLDNSTRGSEAVEAIRIRYMSEGATLISLIRSLEQALNTVYNFIATQLNAGKVVINLDKDIISANLSSAEMKELSEMLVNDTITVESFVYNMRKGGRLAPDRTNAQEIEDVRRGLTEKRERESKSNLRSQA